MRRLAACGFLRRSFRLLMRHNSTPLGGHPREPFFYSIKFMRRAITYSLAVSFIVHALFLIGITSWSLFKTGGMGFGEGLVEVSLVDGFGDGGISNKKKFTQNKVLRKIADALVSSEKQKGEAENNEQTGNGRGEGGGIGFGSGGGEADPRLLEIWRKINGSKYYPEAAKKEGLEGAPKVGFTVSLDGKVNDASLVKSCGHDILDKAALETVRRSSPLPFYPKPITIAVRYSLKD
jgi:TonB family protein